MQSELILKKFGRSGFSRFVDKAIRIFIILVYLLTTSGLSTMRVYAQDTYSLVVTIIGNGTIDGYSPETTYAAGTQVTLTPNPDTGWIFSHWSGVEVDTMNDNGDGTYTLTMNGDYSITATFVNPTTDETEALTYVKNNTTLDASMDGTLINLLATFPDYIPQVLETSGYKINSRISVGPDLPENSYLTINKNGTDEVVDFLLTADTQYWYTEFLGYPLSVSSLFSDSTYESTAKRVCSV
jgi:hypothetical protein